MKIKIIILLAFMLATTGFASANGGGQQSGSGGCLNSNAINSGDHTKIYTGADAYSTISGKTAEFHLVTTNTPGSGVIALCVYNTSANKYTEVTEIYNPSKWQPVPPTNKKDYFGFRRIHGNDLIPLDSVRDILIGQAKFSTNPDTPVILLHIKDKKECGKEEHEEDEENIGKNYFSVNKNKDSEEDEDDNKDGDETCWRRAGPPKQEIPEFPTIALPVAAALTIMFVFYRRKKEE